MKPSSLPAIAAFEQVARLGSFTRAAEVLGMSTSALSQTVRKLEAELGVRLLSRTTRKVAPTEVGARFLDGVTPGLAGLAQACEALEDEGEQPRGTLRVALSTIAYTLLVAPHLARFCRTYPGVSVELGLSEGVNEIVGEGFDLGVRLGELLPKDMIATPIGGPQRLVIVGSPAYFAEHPRPTAPHDLLTHDCIRLRFVTSGRINRWWLGGVDGELELDVRGRLIVNTMTEIVGAACEGLGLAQVFAGLARPHVADKRLVRVLQAYSAPFPGFHMYYPSRAQMPAKVRVFIDFFRAANR